MTKNEQRFALRMNMIVDLYDSGRYSFEDIGMVFGVTKERVRQVYRKGTGRVALPDWVLTEFLHSIENAPTVPTVMGKANFDYCPNCGAKMKEAENE